MSSVPNPLATVKHLRQLFFPFLKNCQKMFCRFLIMFGVRSLVIVGIGFDANTAILKRPEENKCVLRRSGLFPAGSPK